MGHFFFFLHQYRTGHAWQLFVFYRIHFIFFNTLCPYLTKQKVFGEVIAIYFALVFLHKLSFIFDKAVSHGCKVILHLQFTSQEAGGGGGGKR